MKKIFILVILSVLMPCAINADAEEIFVSPSATSGGDGSITNPLQSLLEAREAVRKINQDMKEDIYVYLRGGTYQLDDALELTTQDSGTNGYNVIWKSYQNEVAVISGAGNPITPAPKSSKGSPYAWFHAPRHLPEIRHPPESVTVPSNGQCSFSS